MYDLSNKNVLVVGLDEHGQAACELLCHRGGRVLAVDARDTPELRIAASALRAVGAEVELGVSSLPRREFDFLVAGGSSSGLLQNLSGSGAPVISEMELGYQQANAPVVAIAGTNGKGTTVGLVERILVNNHRKVIVCGHRHRPVCALVDQSKEADFLLVEADKLQLEGTSSFRPSVAVLLNLTPETGAAGGEGDEVGRAAGRLFTYQESFDWAVVQSAALGRLRELGDEVRAKTITFSATDQEADLHLDRGLILSRLQTWPGPLLDMDHCQLRGPYNAENIMAALAVGHALRLSLETMADAIKTFSAGPHRCEMVAELNGVQFINDSKAKNVAALRQALLSARPAPGGGANIWLIAGGKDQGLDYHDVGPLLSQRVKRAFLVGETGETGEKIRAAWSLFTPCTVSKSLVEAITEAAVAGASGDVVLFSPASSSLDQFESYEKSGRIFCETVKSIGRGREAATPYMHGKTATT